MRAAAFVAVWMACAPQAFPQEPAAENVESRAAALRASYAAMSTALEQSTIQRGLYVESIESTRAPRGDAYAVVNYPFATIANAFTSPDSWCETLILHLNVQYCRANSSHERSALSAAVGKKTNQPLEDTHRINFIFSVASQSADYMRVELASKNGPLGTANYLIAVEFVPLDDGHSFMHMQYSYTQGFLARVATSVYFATSGRDKVGFTLIQDEEGEPPQLVRGIRGALERNTMRYYLAFDAYLHTLGDPTAERFEESLDRWFSDTERFARQLHEVKRDDYITMKRGQYLRQQTVQ